MWKANKHIVSAIVTLLVAWAPSADAQSQVTLTQLLTQVEHHPEVSMMRAAVEAAEARVPMHSSLMEPRLLLGVQNVPTSFSFREDPMTAKVIGIEQMLPYPGKLSKEQTIGEYAVDISTARLEEARNTLRRDVKVAWYDLLHRQRSINVNLRHVQLLDNFKEELAVRVAYGKAPISQIDLLELEQTEIEQMIAEDSSMTAMQKAKLQYITSIDVTNIPNDSFPIRLVTQTLEALMTAARAHNPRLAAIRAEILQSGAEIDRAKLEKYPDFDVMLMYMQRDDIPGSTHGSAGTPQMDMLSAQVSITLPFINYGGNKDAVIAEMEAMRAMKLAEQDQMEREIRMMLSEKMVRLQELRRKHQLFTSSSIPTLDARIKALSTEYQFDKTSFQSAIAQVIIFLHKQHEVFEIESEYMKTLAEIEFTIGSDIFSSAPQE